MGGGMVGCVAAMYLARRFGRVEVLERDTAVKRAEVHTARSLTVILSARGWRVLDDLGLAERVRALCLPLGGRLAHRPDGSQQYTAYGRHGQRIWSVRRDRLHRLLVSATAATSGVRMHHGIRVQAVDLDGPSVTVDENGRMRRIPCARVIGCDGVHSVVRSALVAAGARQTVRQLSLGYKEIDVSDAEEWRHPRTAFHYWPRGQALFGAFPDIEGGYNGSLFLPLSDGPDNFAGLTSPAVPMLFAERFSDLTARIAGLEEQFRDRPTSAITTTGCDRWHHSDTTVLLGDACHAMTPFMGHGMNCGFEDARVLDECLAAAGDWASALKAYERRRRPDVELIVRISHDHYRTLSRGPHRADRTEAVLDRLSRLLPEPRFDPLYERCAFSHDSYATVLSDARAARHLADSLLAAHGPRLLEGPDETFRAAARALTAVQPHPLQSVPDGGIHARGALPNPLD
ncbi:NAD(P)/FAD-dependent oxidoreductase [Streptomyces sp. NPDC052036]|uniref:FAD-dependent oxidoreductase n=1 Tax=Streptomyces sp. NPDC052036 TaxID=3155171 RepID=UPI00341F422D